MHGELPLAVLQVLQLTSLNKLDTHHWSSASAAFVEVSFAGLHSGQYALEKQGQQEVHNFDMQRGLRLKDQPLEGDGLSRAKHYVELSAELLAATLHRNHFEVSCNGHHPPLWTDNLNLII